MHNCGRWTVNSITGKYKRFIKVDSRLGLDEMKFRIKIAWQSIAILSKGMNSINYDPVQRPKITSVLRELDPVRGFC